MRTLNMDEIGHLVAIDLTPLQFTQMNDVLSNDENSTDDELIKLFVESGIHSDIAKVAVALRYEMWLEPMTELTVTEKGLGVGRIRDRLDRTFE